MRFATDRVCIVMMSAVGDTVHVLPVLHALKRANPAMKVTWILQPGPAMLVRGHALVDEIILFDRSKGWRGYLEVREQLKSRRFDLVLDLQVYFKANIICSFVNAPVKLGFDFARARDLNWLFTTHRIPPHAMQHVQDQYLEFCSYLGAPTSPVEWNLGPWNDQERTWQRDFYAQFDRPVVPIVVATSKAQKDWVPERWAEVCDALHGDFGLQPVLVGGRSPREENAERIIMEKARIKPFSNLGNGGLRGLVGVLDKAALVLSLDTGPLHITVALDRPVIALMGYSNPKRVGPYRKFGDLAIDAYGEPGEDYPITMENHPDRMARITVQDVLDKVEVWRSRYRQGEAGA
ncbi:lipopolysaccharide heptosyltransferase family protein [Geomonas terrae]|uniref:Lipopolysaccharide heptosyltransferase family protein n=1 Tax=Geomonas terrae TaxID=2562681 RepID=A0A4S1C9U6_9BACT|nr:glycosyltransferase family 9 protein [Geomonas terrae]TGU70067.1 lipopolysaccharide heptosyltransferase family protein [Geomonas terrae]